jgi:hypothetical protein
MANATKIEAGTKVIYGSYEGVVARVCDWDTNMIEVRLPGGLVCIGKSCVKVVK